MNSLSENKKVNIVLLTFIIIYPWYLSITGIDMTDTGYWLTLYQNFFDETISSGEGFSCWFSLFLGGITNITLGNIGLFGFKIVHIFTIYLTLWIVYRFLKKYASNMILLFSFSIALIFINIDALVIVNYDMLTLLFYMIASYFLYFALIENKKYYFFIVGIILGINIFIRLPNLLGISFILIIFYYDFRTEGIKKNTLKKSFYLIIGYVISIVSMLTLMKILGHSERYINQIKTLVNFASETNFHHSASSLVDNFINDQFFAFMYGFFLLVIILFISWLSRFWNTSRKMIWSSAFFFSILATLSIMHLSNIFLSVNYYFLHISVIGLIYIVLIIIIIKNFHVNKTFSTITLLAFLVIELIPLGSNTHLRKAISGLYIGLPVILIYVYSLSSIKIGILRWDKNETSFIKVFVSMTLILFSIIVSSFYFSAYGDSHVKWKMSSSVNSPLLHYNLTTKERATVLNEILKQIQIYEKNYEYILTYNSIPMIKYLSKSKSYLGSSNPLFYSSFNLKKELETSIKEKSLPFIVRAKTITSIKDWPKVTYKINKNTGLKEYINIRAIFEDFLKVNHYQTSWQNKDFEILIPNPSIID